MSSDEAVTHWIGGLKSGDPAAIQKLWELYFEKLVFMARKKLQMASRRVSDEEDVALSAFNSFCQGVAKGNFPDLEDRDNLWRILVVITARKAIDQIQYEHRQRRGGGKVRGESVFDSEHLGEMVPGLQQAIGKEPTPEFAAQVAEESQRLLDRLEDDTLRQIALWKMEGYTHDEIATQLGCTTRTIKRKLQLIRLNWSGETDDEGESEEDES